MTIKKRDTTYQPRNERQTPSTASNGPLANEDIRVEKLQVIGADGFNFGILSRREALNQAYDSGLDLVLLSETGGMGVPVAKIMDYGKELYARKKKQGVAKKNQKVIQIKEIKISPKIGEHDYQTKMNQGIGFLEEGKKIKITLLFRGRELVNKNERGNELFQKIDQTFAERGLLERIIHEKDLKTDSAWSKVFSLK
jgi:translation initiation factor IF-3